MWRQVGEGRRKLWARKKVDLFTCLMTWREKCTSSHQPVLLSTQERKGRQEDCEQCHSTMRWKAGRSFTLTFPSSSSLTTPACLKGQQSKGGGTLYLFPTSLISALVLSFLSQTFQTKDKCPSGQTIQSSIMRDETCDNLPLMRSAASLQMWWCEFCRCCDKFTSE